VAWRGIWQRIFQQIAGAGDMPVELLIDSTHVKALRSALAARGRVVSADRSRSGRTSKAHGLADDRGRPVLFALTPGNIADIGMAIPLPGAVLPPRRVNAEAANDADGLRAWLMTRHIQAVITSTASRAFPWPLDRTVHARRNLIERLFCRHKYWRRLAQNYLAASPWAPPSTPGKFGGPA
jgi:transposase